MTEPHFDSPHVTLYHGDCLDILRQLPDNSVDSVTTDPPYGLSNTDPAHVTETLTAWIAGDREYLPATGGGFMGKSWDAFVPPVAVWDECLRVLKPGGHLLAFAGSRTQDLMGLSLRLAGFEIRDTIAWMYGSGFPKSLDISKAIDKAAGRDAGDTEARYEATFAVTRWLRSQITERNVSAAAINAYFNASNIAQEWLMTEMGAIKRPRVPTWEQWQQLCDWLELPHDMDAEVWRLNGNKGQPAPLAFTRDRKTYEQSHGFARVGLAHGAQKSHTATAQVEEIGFATGPGDTPVTDEAARWQGWGTALKPAHEPIILARKPLSGTVAQTVLEYGTGALNIDGSRIGTSPEDAKAMERANTPGSGRFTAGRSEPGAMGRSKPGTPMDTTRGRWPSNVVLDPETAAQLDTQSGITTGTARVGAPGGHTFGGGEMKAAEGTWFGDTGGASRYFRVVTPDPPFMYTAKAGSDERPRVARDSAGEGRILGNGLERVRQCNICGNKTIRPPATEPACGHGDWQYVAVEKRDDHIAHPTVKPLDLMRWLVKLVTPPGGTILEPFAGSGTTAEAAILEGFRCIAIEREADYLPLIVQRISKPHAIGLDLEGWEPEPAPKAVKGRWPANVVLSESQAAALDQQSGIQRDGTAVNRNRDNDQLASDAGWGYRKQFADVGYGGEGGASRFFKVVPDPKPADDEPVGFDFGDWDGGAA